MFYALCLYLINSCLWNSAFCWRLSYASLQMPFWEPHVIISDLVCWETCGEGASLQTLNVFMAHPLRASTLSQCCQERLRNKQCCISGIPYQMPKMSGGFRKKGDWNRHQQLGNCRAQLTKASVLLPSWRGKVLLPFSLGEELKFNRTEDQLLSYIGENHVASLSAWRLCYLLLPGKDR